MHMDKCYICIWVPVLICICHQTVLDCRSSSNTAAIDAEAEGHLVMHIHRFLSILKCLLDGRDLTVSVFVDFFFCELLFDGHADPKNIVHLNYTVACKKTQFSIILSCRNLLDFHFLIGNSISVKLSWNIFCLSHPRDHFGMLLGS